MASLITDEARAMIGVTSEPGVHRVDHSQIRLFAEAIGDPNPLYVDEEYARTTRWGSIIAPPTFIYNFRPGAFPEIPLPTTRLLNGGDEFEYFGVVRPGDVIVVVSKWVDLYERTGRLLRARDLRADVEARTTFLVLVPDLGPATADEVHGVGVLPPGEDG
ncbi:MAG: MaoC family dehydratase N-terminal domain-containing protein, partial [Chloroflexi bacterium]|nr:MaoC family dehydratase N-terminal domain-containing protein [Chloroflexota bacterium]